MEINAADFKAGCLKRLGEVDRTGEEIVVLKQGRPVARVVLVHEEHPWLKLRGSGWFLGDRSESLVMPANVDALR